MVQAAAANGLDFSAAAPRSRHWWLKVRWIVDQLEDENMLKLLEMQHIQHVASLDYTVDKQAFDHHWKAANELLQVTHNIHFPWMKSTDTKNSEIDALLSKWKEKFGDPKDPAVQAKFKAVADAWMKKGEKSKANMFSSERQGQKDFKNLMANRKRRSK